MQNEPIIIITPPEVIQRGFETYNDDRVTIREFDYTNSHIIYKNQDLGSFKELLKQNKELLKQNKEINNLREAVEENNDYIQYLHKIFEEKVIGKKGKCTCGKKGTYCYDPYDEEINEVKLVTCLCEECYQERVWDI